MQDRVWPRKTRFSAVAITAINLHMFIFRCKTLWIPIYVLTIYVHTQENYTKLTIIIITEDDLSNVYTVEEAVHKIGFGVFQILLSMFCGLIWVIIIIACTHI